MNETRQRAADWHGAQAAKAYRKGPKERDAFVRHVRIADQIWSEARG